MAKEQSVAQVRLYVDRHNTNAQKVYRKLGMEECHYLMYETTVEVYISSYLADFVLTIQNRETDIFV